MNATRADTTLIPTGMVVIDLIRNQKIEDGQVTELTLEEREEYLKVIA